jgi:cytochrome c oxidase subunit 1
VGEGDSHEYVQRMTGEGVIQHEEDNADPNIHLPAPSYWPMVLAFSLPIMAYGVIYNMLLVVAGGAIAVMAMFGWALEPADADLSDYDPTGDGDETSKELANV